MKNKWLLFLFIGMLVLLFSGCIPGDGSFHTERQAGFFWGIWHGWIAPFSLIYGFFVRNIRIYEAANIGWWYDLGFYMAVISGFGGISLGRKKVKKTKVYYHKD